MISADADFDFAGIKSSSANEDVDLVDSDSDEVDGAVEEEARFLFFGFISDLLKNYSFSLEHRTQLT